MTRKDIALTVGGVLATMVLAYLLYRLQQRDAAAAAANAANSEQDQEAEAEQQQEYLAELPTVSGGTTDSTSLSTSNEGTTDTTASSGTDGDAATESLLTNIIADFAGSINQGTPGANANASIIPTINSSTLLGLTPVPTTASDALAGVANTLGGSGGSAGTATTTPSSPARPILSETSF